MTQHFLATKLVDGSDVVVMTGYDRPLDGFFLLIERKTPLDDDDEGIVFSQLDSADPNPQNFSFIENVLSGFGVSLPKEMVAEINEDRDLRRGNAITVWDQSGTKVSSKKDGTQMRPK